MTAQYIFKLGIYDPLHDGKVISCTDYLQQREAGTISWLPSKEDSTLFIYASGREWIGEEWNLGNFKLLLAQVKEMKERLDNRKPAIIRSAVLDQLPVPYFLFLTDPQNDQVIHISQFFIMDPSIGNLFPIDYGRKGESEELYAYVRKNHIELIAANPFPELSQHAFRNIPFPLPELKQALAREIPLGEKVTSLLG